MVVIIERMPQIQIRFWVLGVLAIPSDMEKLGGRSTAADSEYELLLELKRIGLRIGARPTISNRIRDGPSHLRPKS